HKRKNGAKACPSKSLPVYTLRQICCSVIAPLAGVSPDGSFEEAWVEEHVERIVAFTDTLQFHLKTSEVLATPWKNTAKRDAWAYRRALVRQQETHNNEVIS
ncbi:MAG TPA: hypothetical protein DIW48_04470, partial [Sphaerochaeta sp.]|nr:hypothetical protein [Sphaerochaeta sp.]